MNAGADAVTGIRAIAEHIVIAGRSDGLERVHAGTTAVAHIAGAGICVGRAGGIGRREAIVGRFVAGVGADGSAGAWIACVNAACSCIAGISSVAIQAVVACRAEGHRRVETCGPAQRVGRAWVCVVTRDRSSGAVASRTHVIVGRGVSVVAGRSVGIVGRAGVGRFIAGFMAVGVAIGSGARIPRVNAAASAAARIRTVAKQAVRATRAGGSGGVRAGGPTDSIHRAGIAIIAIDGDRSAGADACRANIVGRCGISIVAQRAVGIGRGAGAACFKAGFRAVSVAIGAGAGISRMNAARAVIARVAAVAKQAVVAGRSVRVGAGAIVQRFVAGFRAIGIAIRRRAGISRVNGARSSAARVCSVAKQSVVAWAGIGRVEAGAAGAGIGGAWIGVVAAGVRRAPAVSGGQAGSRIPEAGDDRDAQRGMKLVGAGD